MKIYLCCMNMGRVNENRINFTLSKEEAMKWKVDSQWFENCAARDGFRGARKMVVRAGGDLPDEGPTATITEPGSGAGVAQIFELEVSPSNT